MLTIPTIPDGTTQQGAAIIYASEGMEVFPVVPKGKFPIRDEDLGFTNGWQTATSDKKLLAKAFHKHPNAGIAWKIPLDIVIVDCDVLKDDKKRPMLKDGKPDQRGLQTLQDIINGHGAVSEFKTYRNRTQSGGLQYFFHLTEQQEQRSKDENLRIKNRRAFDYIDIKTQGGYVVMPPSEGKYGRYETVGHNSLSPLPEWLFDLISEAPGQAKYPVMITNDPLEKSSLQSIFDFLLPYWEKANGKRNELALAIDGSMALIGIPMDQRRDVLSALAKASGKGWDHTNVSHYSEQKVQKGQHVYGFTRLDSLMKELDQEAVQ